MTSILRSTNLRICLQYLLLVSLLWVGPIPIGHSHATVTNSGANGAELAQHIKQYHSGGICNYVGCNWHLHWVFRGATYTGINAEASIIQPMSNTSLVSSEHVVQVLSQPLSGEYVRPQYRTLDALIDTTLSGSNWLSGHAMYRLSSPTLSSVMRC